MSRGVGEERAQKRRSLLRRKINTSEDSESSEEVEDRIQTKDLSGALEIKTASPADGFLKTVTGEVLLHQPGSSPRELIRSLLSKRKKSLGLFPGIRGEGIDLSGGDWRGVRFAGSYLPGADFSNSLLDGASFESGSSLAGASFKGVNGRGVRIIRAGAAGADFTDAILVGAYIMGDLRECNFTGANLTGAQLNNSDLRGAILVGAILKDTNLAGSKLDGLDLQEAPCFSRRRLESTGFRGADLRSVFFHHSRLFASSFAGANLWGASFQEADLTEVDFTDCDLENVDFRGAKGLKEANLSGTGYDSFLGRRKLLAGGNLRKA